MYYKHGTPLERELASLKPEDRATRLKEIWDEFRRTRAFDLLTLTLRDLEWQALQTIKTRPTREHPAAGIMMHVVEDVRRHFEALGRIAPDDPADANWGDEVDFWDIEEGSVARGE
jgi:hypothetical protein